MNRLSTSFAVVVGLSLALTACVPLDEATTVSSPFASVVPSGDVQFPFDPAPRIDEQPPEQLPEQPRTDLPLREYSAAGLEDRISKLPPSMTAHQIHRGSAPFLDGVPGSEKVLLAEHLTSSSRLALPGKAQGNSFLVEVTCSRSTNLEVTLFDDEGTPLAGGMSTQCSPAAPDGFGLGMQESPVLGQLQLIYDQESSLQLSLVAYTTTTTDESG